MTDENIEGSGRGTMTGYIVEWRCTKEVVVCGGSSFWDCFPKMEWGHAPYSIKSLQVGDEAKRLTRPVISDWDSGPHSLSQHGLVREIVAEAILACVKTQIEDDLGLQGIKDFIELRVRKCALTYEYKVVREGKDESPG